MPRYILLSCAHGHNNALPSCAALHASLFTCSHPQAGIESTPELEQALRDAAVLGDHGKLRKLLEAKIVNIEAKDTSEQRRTALHYASFGGHVRAADSSIVRLLLEHGADPNVEDRHGDTTVHVAARGGRSSCLKVLLDYGADFNAIGGVREE